MRIIIRSLSGQQVSMDVDPSSSIAELQRQIAQKHKIPQEAETRLVYAGKELHPKSTIGQSGIQKESVVHWIAPRNQLSGSKENNPTPKNSQENGKVPSTIQEVHANSPPRRLLIHFNDRVLPMYCRDTSTIADIKHNFAKALANMSASEEVSHPSDIVLVEGKEGQVIHEEEQPVSKFLPKNSATWDLFAFHKTKI